MTSTSPAARAGRPKGLAAGERAALAALLTDLGPDVRTLCDGWSTAQLAAHLVTREGRPDALAGILIPALHGYTARLERSMFESVSYPGLVRRIETGPPLGRSLVALPFADDQVNLHEFFVHHEDVRRAQPDWTSRTLPDELDAGLWGRLRLVAPMLFRGLKNTRLTLRTPDGRSRSVGKGDDEVVVSGPVSELFLFSFGRRAAAAVEFDGPRAAQDKLSALSLAM